MNIRWSSFASTEDTMRHNYHNPNLPKRGYISQALDVISGAAGKHTLEDIAKAKRILRASGRDPNIRISINCQFKGEE